MAVPLLLDAETTRRYQSFVWGNPMLGWLGILLAWQVLPSVFRPLWLVVVNAIHLGVSYG